MQQPDLKPAPVNETLMLYHKLSKSQVASINNHITPKFASIKLHNI